MAITVNYAHSTGNYLSETQLPGSEVVYYLKDADLRAIVEAFGNATSKDALVGAIADSVTSGNLTSAEQVVNYVTTALADLSGAMHFIGVSTTDPMTAVTVDGKIITPRSGDIVIYGTKEYVYSTNEWKELGDESLWVPDTRTIAELPLSSDITVTQLKSKLGLGNMAYVDQGTVSIQPKGSVSVTLKDATTTTDATIAQSADYTPAGTISSAEATGSDVNYTPDGSVGLTPTTATFSAGTMTSVADSPSTQFSTNGIVASVTGERLVFANTSKAVALVKSDITVGTAPTLKTGSEDITSVLTGVTGSFTGKGAKLSFAGQVATGLKPTKITYVKQEVNEASFSGTSETLDVSPKTNG